MAVPPTAGRALDHVVIAVEDLDAARAALIAIGFNVQPRGGHPSFGTLNHTMMLASGYFELLAIGTRRPENDYLAGHLARGGGLVGLAFASSDVAATERRLHAAGVATAPIASFARPVSRNGATGEARFRTLTVGVPLGFDGYAFFCEHGTPELVWLPGSTLHANGAQHILSALVRADGTAPAAALAALADPGTVGPVPALAPEGRLTIAVDRLPDPDAARSAGFAVRSDAAGCMMTHPALGAVALVLSPAPPQVVGAA